MSPVSTIQPATLGELFSEPFATRPSVNEELNRTPTGISSVLHTSSSGRKCGFKYQNDQNTWKP